VIHLVTLDPFPEPVVGQVRSRLYLAFGVGCEHTGHHAAPIPRRADRFDAAALLSAEPPFESYSDDRVLYLTSAELALPAGPLGVPPAHGFSLPKVRRAVVSSSRIAAPQPATPEEDEAWLTYGDRLGKHAVQQMGFLWGLRRCLDHHCAMATPWDEDVADDDATLCEFCRKKSEVSLQGARS